MIKEIIGELSRGKDLEPVQMSEAMEEIMGGAIDTAEIVSFLLGLNKKGFTTRELAAAAVVMRKHVTRIIAKDKIILDTCGTGGDKKGTFNISTIAAFVASACGITVAKHGNRSVSSSCGSADILEALGVNINLTPQRIEECLNDIGIAFLFAPNLHPAMKFAMPARKQIAAKTIFNILGPLTNPASATHQLVGVYDIKLTRDLAEVFKNLGTMHSLVVHGEDGLDEITIAASTFVAEQNLGEISTYKINPQDYGLKKAPLKDLAAGTLGDNLKIFQDVLGGKPGPCRDAVLLNAGAAIYAADKVKSIKEGIELATGSIDSAHARDKFESLKRYSNEI